MSGHSHWSTIKRKKAASDEKKGKIFSKMSRAITVAARRGGGDPGMNAALRLAIEKAKATDMPKDNIERAIKKGTGAGSEGANYEEVTYEGYGPEGVAILVKVLTDNKNRTVSEMRNLFGRYGGSLGSAGSAAYIFTPDPQSPTFTVPVSDSAKVKLEGLLEELEDHDDVQDYFTNAA